MQKLLPLSGVAVAVAVAVALALPCPSQAPERATRPNILLITADDMNFDSTGVYGCKIQGITSNMDALATAGMRFLRAHVTIAVCQPCRSVLMTGRYPHRNGAKGFEPIREDIPTLTGELHRAGYFNGILGKVKHLAPRHRFYWDHVTEVRALGQGRSPSKYYQYAVAFLKKAKAAGKPFFLMANSHDPHRPFAGSQQEKQRIKRKGISFPKASRYYKPEEVEVPGFLPDIKLVRKEIAEYYSSVHRCDETVGEILRALRESGQEKNTIVVFLSDHGMPLPYAKTNCYLNSTKVPWIVRWPGVVEADSVDGEHFISGIDLMPTLLEAVGLQQGEGMDGRSFVPLLRGKKQEDREQVLTVFHRTAGKRDYPMRCLQNRRYGYIFNAWSDGKTVFRNESQSGRSFRAMRAAGKSDQAIAARVDFFLYRVVEELYDFESDPNALRNLVGSKEHAEILEEMRQRLLELMVETKDPLLSVFEARRK